MVHARVHAPSCPQQPPQFTQLRLHHAIMPHLAYHLFVGYREGHEFFVDNFELLSVSALDCSNPLLVLLLLRNQVILGFVGNWVNRYSCLAQLWLFWLDLGVKLSLELGNPVLSFSAPDWQSVVLSYQSLDFWVLGSFIHIDVELSFFSALLSLKFSLINSPLQYSDLLLISFLFLPEANLIIYSASVLTSFVELLNKSFMFSFKCVILMNSWVIVVTKIFHISYFLQELSFSLLELSNSIGAFLIFVKKLNFMYFYSVHFFG